MYFIFEDKTYLDVDIIYQNINKCFILLYGNDTKKYLFVLIVKHKGYFIEIFEGIKYFINTITREENNTIYYANKTNKSIIKEKENNKEKKH